MNGHTGRVACLAARITYRQLDYWARTGLAEPSLQPASGSGSVRLYSRDDIVRLATIRLLLDLGLALPVVRESLDMLTSHGYLQVCSGDWPVARITLDPYAIARDVDQRLDELEDEPPLRVVS